MNRPVYRGSPLRVREETEGVHQCLTGCLASSGTSNTSWVASGFNGMTRVADVTGLCLDGHIEATPDDMREIMGINAFTPAEKWV